MSANEADWTAQDRAAATAVRNHHAELAAGLEQHTKSLLALVDAGHAQEAEQVRQALLGYLHRELLPHAHAEEQRLYPAAATRPAATLLIDGMLGEHRAIGSLVEELESAESPTRAAATARALSAVFTNHLAKEDELVVPLIAADPDVSLAELLAGMHELLGAQH